MVPITFSYDIQNTDYHRYQLTSTSPTDSTLQLGCTTRRMSNYDTSSMLSEIQVIQLIQIIWRNLGRPDD
jgi:hypothetical protein